MKGFLQLAFLSLLAFAIAVPHPAADQIDEGQQGYGCDQCYYSVKEKRWVDPAGQLDFASLSCLSLYVSGHYCSMSQAYTISSRGPQSIK